MKFFVYTMLVLSLITLTTSQSYAQNETPASNALMPSLDNFQTASPNVAALNRFGDIPVGPSTGIPQVTVPIYSWESQTFGKGLSISLDYHAGGIKVDDTASDVGLGWALNAGGVISRTVRGIYDEFQTYGFLYNGIPETESQGNLTNGVNRLHRMFYGHEDNQADLFNFNFNGRNGHFVLGKDNRTLLLEESKLKIERFITKNTLSWDVITSFIITDEEGYKYKFDQYEVTSLMGSGSAGPKIYTSAWYLTEILHPNGSDKITFQYEDFGTYVRSRASASEARPIYDLFNLLSHSASGGSENGVESKRLTSISFPDGNTVNFTYKNEIRSDIEFGTGKMLDKITISKDDKKRGFKLVQDYSLNGRATLRSVTEFGGVNETLLKPYTFQYSTQTLPNKLSHQIDHWGYANNNTGGSFPKEIFRVDGGQYPPYSILNGGDRDTDPTRILAGSLVRIDYPTGGYTVFEMEANQAKDQWLEQNIPVTIQRPPYTDKDIHFTIDGQTNMFQLPFVFTGENNTTTWFTASLQSDGQSSSGVRFELYNKLNQMVNTRTIYFPSNAGSFEQTFSVSNMVKNDNYHFKVYPLNLPNYYDYANLTRREINQGGSYDTVLRHVQPYVGGLRAKRISDYTHGNSTPAKVREYDYLLEDGVTTSGTLGIRPVYSYTATYDYRISKDPHNDQYFGRINPPNYLIRTNGAIHNAIFVNGSPVVYKRVVERTVSNGASLGKTIRNFTSFAESRPYISEVLPFIPPDVPSFYYGKLLKEEIFNENNTLLSSIVNEYQFTTDRYASITGELERFRGVVFAPVQFYWEGSVHVPKIDPSGFPTYFLMASISPITGKADLKKSVSTTYNPGGSPIVTTTDYFYDHNYFQLKETSTTDSRGRVAKSQFKYPHDFVANNVDAAIYQEMLSKNIISPIIEEKTLVDATQLTSKTTRYLKWHNKFFAPERVKMKIGALAEEDRIVYLQYDQYGAPLSAQQVSGPKVNYVWGYGGAKLIAQVNNAEYSTIQTLLGGAAAIELFRNKKAPTEAEINTFLQPLRNNLPAQAQVVTFIHDTLTGMTSKTDPRGQTEYYEYDGFQRLKEVLDFERNVLTDYQYHYKP